MIADVDIERFLDSNGHACSSEAFALAVVMLDTGAYVSARESVLASTAPNFVFMITVLGDPEVDRIYESAVKPTLEANGLQVARADEIRRAGLVMDSVNQAIASSRFVVADLTRARPNTYYEVGYAHALGKPVILIAKTETERHFDIAGHRWNHWKPDADFRPIFDAEVRGVLKQLSESKRGVASDG